MNDSKFKVLLYSDGSHQAFSAAVYTATLLQKMPNMHLTIARLQDNEEDNNLPKYNWIKSWPDTPTSEWIKRVLDESHTKTDGPYKEILFKTVEIFSNEKFNVEYQSLNAKHNSISDTAKVIINHATNNSYKLIVMGTRGLSTLNGLIFGSLAHHVLDDSPIPVLLIKKLPQTFIDNYLSQPSTQI